MEHELNDLRVGTVVEIQPRELGRIRWRIDNIRVALPVWSEIVDGRDDNGAMAGLDGFPSVQDR